MIWVALQLPDHFYCSENNFLAPFLAIKLNEKMPSEDVITSNCVSTEHQEVMSLRRPRSDVVHPEIQKERDERTPQLVEPVLVEPSKSATRQIR